jgi:hypothetical protein
MIYSDFQVNKPHLCYFSHSRLAPPRSSLKTRTLIRLFFSEGLGGYRYNTRFYKHFLKSNMVLDVDFRFNIWYYEVHKKELL